MRIARRVVLSQVRRSIAALALALTALLTVPAAGSDTEADRIRAEIEMALAFMFLDAGAGRLELGPVEVAGGGPDYMVTLPSVRMLTDMEGFLDVGNVTFGVTARDDGELLEIKDLKLPASMQQRTADGRMLATLTLPSQAFSAVWSMSIHGFLSLDGAYRDIEFAGPDGKTLVALAALTAVASSAERPTSGWDLVWEYAAEGLAVGMEDGQFEIDRMAMSSDTRGADLERYGALVERMWSTGPDPAALSAQTADLIGVLGDMLVDSTMTIQAAGIRLRDAAGAEAFNLRDAAMTLAGTALDTDRAMLNLTLRQGELSLAPAAPGVAGPAIASLAPRRLQLAFDFEDLPVRTIWAALGESAAAAPAPEVGAAPPAATGEGESTADAAPDPAESLLAALPTALIEARSSLRLSDWRIEMPDGTIAVDGTIEASGDAVFAAVADVSLDITGLDAMIETAHAAFGGAESGDALAPLELLRAMSVRTTGSDGATVDHYAIALTPEGMFTVNGKDASFLLSMP